MVGEYIELFLIALSLSMDAFAVSITNGMTIGNYTKNQKVLTSLTFGIMQGLMPLLGYFLGQTFFVYIEKIDHWIAFLLLGFIGAKMIYEAMEKRKNPDDALKDIRFGYKSMFLQSLATSIDAFAVGVSFAFAFTLNIYFSVSAIALVTFLCCLGGVYIGRRFGQIFKGKAEIMGGIILIAIGVKILIEHLFF